MKNKGMKTLALQKINERYEFYTKSMMSMAVSYTLEQDEEERECICGMIVGYMNEFEVYCRAFWEIGLITNEGFAYCRTKAYELQSKFYEAIEK